VHFRYYDYHHYYHYFSYSARWAAEHRGWTDTDSIAAVRHPPLLHPLHTAVQCSTVQCMHCTALHCIAVCSAMLLFSVQCSALWF
jgi:hypothetical protein